MSWAGCGEADIAGPPPQVNRNHYLGTPFCRSEGASLSPDGCASLMTSKNRFNKSYCALATTPISIGHCRCMNLSSKKRSSTMRDVARLAEVSVATVSAVVNGKQVVRPVIVARVQDAMKALNFHPDHVARSLRVKKTTTLGVIVPDFSSGFFVDVLRGIEDAARKVGYSVLLCNSDDDREQEPPCAL
jgi:hypothetical protein